MGENGIKTRGSDRRTSRYAEQKIMKKTRNIILFIHLQNTGGSTFRRSMSTRVHGRHYVGVPDHVNIKTLADIQLILKNNPDACVIGGHQIWIKPEDLTSTQVRFFPIFFVRSWFDWNVSKYYSVRRRRDLNTRGFHTIVALTGSLNEYLRLIADGHIPSVCSNNHLPVFKHLQAYVQSSKDQSPSATKMSAGKKGVADRKKSPVKDDQLMQYMSMYHIGITERYDESLVVMEHELVQYFPDIDLSYATLEHSNPDKSHMLPYREEKNTADPEVLGLVERRIGDVIRVYDLANAELDRKISLIPNFEQRLEHFRFRCKIKL